MPNKPLRLSICRVLILDLAFSLHIIISLLYNSTYISNTSSSTLGQSNCKIIAFTGHLIAPSVFLPLSRFQQNLAPYVPDYPQHIKYLNSDIYFKHYPFTITSQPNTFSQPNLRTLFLFGLIFRPLL